MKKRSNPEDNTVPYVIGGVAVLGGLFLLSRRSNGAIGATPGEGETVGPTVTPPQVRRPTPQTERAAPVPTGNSRPVLSQTVINRMVTTDDPSARNLFIFQALLYSWGFSRNIPDGLNGPHTGDDVAAINHMANPGAPASRVFSAAMVNKAIVTLHQNNVIDRRYLLPFKMPTTIIRDINYAAGLLYPGLLLQVLPSD